MGWRWPLQLLAEMYACLKTNDNQEAAFDVLTNDNFWQFFKLDPELTAHVSCIKIRPDHTDEILSILYSFFSGGLED